MRPSLSGPFSSWFRRVLISITDRDVEGRHIRDISRSRVIRLVSLHAISAVCNRTGRIGVGVIVITWIVAIVISETGADQ
jgi:hypothetical protein